ncbi:MAG: penicillin-binding transpeptidase domain-containing protein [Clostridia bacterium]|nr:penicillin-binding transpeptidase domain-containing protein [Clostridia bacterium]
MSRSVKAKSERKKNKSGSSIQSRLQATLVIFGIALLIVIGRLVQLQFVEAEELQQYGMTQWTRGTMIEAARGDILDRNGTVLAKSGTAYKVLLWPNNISASDRERVATELSELFGLSFSGVYEKVCDTTKQEIVLVRQASRETIDALYALKLGNGVATTVDTVRYYPYSSVLAQVLGYTTIDSVGQAGLELSLNKYLSGESGKVVSDVDKDGNTLVYGVEEYIEPTDGCDVVLTIDIAAQAMLERVLSTAREVNNASNAQGIIMDCTTGEIIAMATVYEGGTLDLNAIDRSDITELTRISRNKVVADSYEPGSTFKIVTLAAALDSGAIDSGFTAFCPGHRIVSGQRIKCWRTSGHGSQNLTESTENSCNCAFMDMALQLGIEEFYEYIDKFGFGSDTGSQLLSESAGIVIDQKYVRDINLARIGFGQSVAVTPIQLASAVSAAVNGGTLYQPYITDRIVSADGTVIVDNEPTVVRQVISEATSAQVREILESVVANGSGKNAQVPGYRIGGKTGTAQKYDSEGKISTSLIASFVGFAPADDPRFVVLILVDEPKVGVIYGSTVAAPFVGEAMGELLSMYGYLPESMQDTVTVPSVLGLTVEEAVALLEEYGLGAVFQAEDQVTAQIPIAGTVVNKGTEVLLYTPDTGEVPEEPDVDITVMPDLQGMTRLEAYDLLKQMGLGMEVEGDYEGGVVIYQSVAAGADIEYGTVVRVRFGIENGE